MRKKPLLFALPVFFAFFAVFAEDVIHTLQRGETLFSLSRKYGVSAEAIMEANNISNPDRINAGAELKIPLSENGGENARQESFFYAVEQGDSLYGLARRFGVTVTDLAAANGLDRNAQLKIGDRLSIPAAPTESASEIAVAANVKPVSEGTGTSAPLSAMEDPRGYEKKKIDSSVIWPVEAEEVAYLTGKIYGVSITASQGADVKNIASGTVLSIGPYRGFGQVVFVQSRDGYIYVYGGLEDIGVRNSERLAFGDSLGTLGFDPLSGKSQLYFMVYKKDFPVDPATAPRG